MKNIRNAVVIITLFGMSLYGGDAKLSATTHLHYSYEDAVKNEFALKRAYFTYAKQMNSKVSYKFQIDVGSGIVSDYSVYLKKAKVDLKTDFGKFTLGIQGLNIFSVQEKNWSYRFIEKSAMDKNKFASSSDMGLGWSMDFRDMNTSIIISNGSGYKSSETDGHKKVSARLTIGEIKLKQGFNGGVILTHENLNYGVGGIGQSVVSGVYAGFASKPVKFGLESSVHYTIAESESKQLLHAAYGHLNLRGEMEVFARVDYFDEDPEIRLDAETYLITGVNFQVAEGFMLAPNIRMSIPEEGEKRNIYMLNFLFNY